MKSLVSLVTLLIVACGPKATPTTPVGGAGDGSAAVSALPDVAFEQLDHDQQIQFMKERVVPTMGPLFKEHDPEKFKDFGCKTCHGPRAENGEFEMPNPDLPKLTFADMSKFKKEDLEWMGKVIKPTMAKLLKEPEYSQENPAGFGCAHCHPVEPPAK